MKDKKWNKIGGTLLITFCVLLIIRGFYNANKLKKNHALTIGKITDCRENGVGNGGTVSVDFIFTVNGEQHNGSWGSTTDRFGCIICQKYFYGKWFPAVYEPGNFQNATLLILPSEFERYGYDFPDSQYWVLYYIKDKK